MFRRFFCIIAALAFLAFPAQADEQTFFNDIRGKWTGSGEIVAGKYKGTRFTCVFDGDLPGAIMGMNIDGNCRVGVFNQPMKANVAKKGGKYRGAFLDGAAGKGLDITSGRFLKGKRAFVMGLKRKQLTGAMRAQMSGKNKMNISISVLVNEKYIPVIGLDLKRRG
jgi:hypothetical protein